MSKERLGETRSANSKYRKLQLYLFFNPYRQFRNREGFTGVVIVRKRNTKTSTIDAVRLEPRPPLEMKTANEAKHWAATYALYRVRIS